MDYEFLISLVFSLLVIMIVGGGILLFPITRRLGLLLERRLESEAPPPDEIRKLRSEIGRLAEQVESLQERQDFMDKLLGPGGADPPRRGTGS